MFNDSCIQDFRNHAEASYPNECCGLVVQNMSGFHYFPCVNIAINPSEEFAISPDSYLNAQRVGSVVSIAHSHPNGPVGASMADIASCNKSGLPWVILSFPDLALSTIHPSNQANRPYTGRQFIFGIDDCYSIIQDYYNRELGIKLDDYYREDNFWKSGKNYYMDRFEAQGFRRVSEPQKHDLILMQLSSDVPNHGAIYLGDDTILHHVSRRLSSTAEYSGYWKRITRIVIRHRDL